MPAASYSLRLSAAVMRNQMSSLPGSASNRKRVITRIGGRPAADFRPSLPRSFARAVAGSFDAKPRISID